MQALNFRIEDALRVPMILHRLSAGFPSPADDHLDGEIDLSRLLIANRPATFLFRVAGDCLVELGVHDGDIVIVDRSLTPRHEDVVVAIVEGEHTCKQVLIERDHAPRLVNRNRALEAFAVPAGAEWEVWGVVTCCLRALRRNAGR